MKTQKAANKILMSISFVLLLLTGSSNIAAGSPADEIAIKG